MSNQNPDRISGQTSVKCLQLKYCWRTFGQDSLLNIPNATRPIRETVMAKVIVGASSRRLPREENLPQVESWPPLVPWFSELEEPAEFSGEVGPSGGAGGPSGGAGVLGGPIPPDRLEGGVKLEGGVSSVISCHGVPATESGPVQTVSAQTAPLQVQATKLQHLRKPVRPAQPAGSSGLTGVVCGCCVVRVAMK